MTISEQIEFDVLSLKDYFERLFSIAESVEVEQKIRSESPQQFVNHGVAAFVRPDMVCNTYSLVDFWLAKLCRFHEKNSHLKISHKDIKGSNDLDVYHKYLTKVVSLNLETVSATLEHLNFIRKVRNAIIHGGGHVTEQKSSEIKCIPGVRIQGSLIMIGDDFIWKSLNHAKTYLCEVATSKAIRGAVTSDLGLRH